MNPSAFKDFVVCKALDVISGNGAYRKYLHQNCENGEVVPRPPFGRPGR
jgi:hypothetical protein